MVYSFGIGFGDLNPSDTHELLCVSVVLILSVVMKAHILAQYASPIIDEEIVNFDLYCRLRNEKQVLKLYYVL